MGNKGKRRWLKFIIIAITYILWVVWLENYWWFTGLIVIFDMYITRKVNWTFWKRRNPSGGKQTKLIEWVDAIIFATIAATFIRLFFIEAYTIPTSSMEKSMLVGDYLFVSKTAYGPKLPNTPLSLPFVHNTIPLTQSKKSFTDIVQWEHRRLKGLGDIKRDDIVVFNFPEGDTVALGAPAQSYYQLIRIYGRDRVWKDKSTFGEIVYRPVDKRENYIKRCVAIPGDSLKIVNGQVYINSRPQPAVSGLQYEYIVTTDGSSINPRSLDRLDIPMSNRHQLSRTQYLFSLTSQQAEKLKKEFRNVLSVDKKSVPAGNKDLYIFPTDGKNMWNIDNFDSVWVPQKGVTIKLTQETLPLYRRAISIYENNDLALIDDKIYINGEQTDSYTFKMDYYWMMGDNRHNSLDSRYWGFVPEDHIVGKASFIWFSLDKDKSLFSKIRWPRMFSVIK